MTSTEVHQPTPNGNVGERPDAIVIRPDNRIEYYRGPLGLSELQGLVEGLVQAIDAAFPDLPPATAWMNEEGKYLGLGANPTATAILAASGGMPGDIVSGTMVLTGMPDVEGETTVVPAAWIEAFPETPA